MSNERKVNTNRARGPQPHSTNPNAPGYRAASVNTSRAVNTTARAVNTGTRRKRKKKNAARAVLLSILAIFTVIAISLGGLYWWISSNVFNTDEEGTIQEEFKTAPEFKGDVVNFLLLGLDWEEGRTAKMADMILYVNFDVANNKFNMLQIPRDLFVGENVSTGGTGKINASYSHSEDKENPVNALASIIHDQLKLPVDYYVTIDMDSLKQVIDTFGGIEVYVPRDMSFEGSKLSKGLQTLDGNAAEFFVRCRYGKGFERADLDRLEMQRYFYAGFFKRLRTATAADIIKLTPHLVTYVNTSMGPDTAVGIGLKMLNVPSSNILMARLPVYAAASKYKDAHSIVVGAPEETAELLNTYFRTYTTPISADELNLAKYPTTGSVAESAVQYMGDIEASQQQE